MASKPLVAGVVVLIVLAAAGLFLMYQEVEQVTSPELPEFEEVNDFLAELESYIAFENTDYDFEMEDVFGVE